MYNLKEKAIILLSLFDFMTSKKMEEVLALYDEPEDILKEIIQEVENLVGKENYKKMLEYFDKNLLPSYIDALEKDNVKCITIYSENYPKKLLDLDLPPYILFCKGDISLLNTRCFGIVGSRVPTAYGRTVTQSFARGLAENGLTIVSGLAMGVDKIAHETTLDVGGKTIAVLGGGFKHIYPAMNENLANSIIEKGLLVSEYRPSVRPTAYSFPVRNRIIAGLSDGILITEAGEKSGALHTKEYSLECGRDVFAVPGNITSAKSAGTNRLLKSMQSALVTSYEDILEAYSITPLKNKKPARQLGFNEQIIMNTLQDGEKSFDEIQIKTGLEIKILNSCLTTLQISGLIKKLPGNEYMLSGN